MEETKKTTEKVDAPKEGAEEKTSEAPEPIQEEEEKKEEKKEDPSKKEKDKGYDEIVKEEEGRGKADPEKAGDAFRERKAEREEDEEEEDEKPIPITEEKLREILSQDKIERQGDYAVDIASELSESEKEAKAIMAVWAKRSYPIGMSMREQLREAQGTVNYKRQQVENSELKRTIISKDNVSRDTASTHRDAPELDTPKISADDAKALKSAGFIWNGKLGYYRKELPNKSFLNKDFKTGRQWHSEK